MTNAICENETSKRNHEFLISKQENLADICSFLIKSRGMGKQKRAKAMQFSKTTTRSNLLCCIHKLIRGFDRTHRWTEYQNQRIPYTNDDNISLLDNRTLTLSAQEQK